MNRRGVLAWGVAAALILMLAGIPGLWIWARQRAVAREKAESAAVAALHRLAGLQKDYRERQGANWKGDVAPFIVDMHIRTVSHSVPMHPLWEELYEGDARGNARPTSYGYLFEALPAKGFSCRAFPAKDDRLRTFVIDESGQVLTK